MALRARASTTTPFESHCAAPVDRLFGSPARSVGEVSASEDAHVAPHRRRGAARQGRRRALAQDAYCRDEPMTGFAAWPGFGIAARPRCAAVALTARSARVAPLSQPAPGSGLPRPRQGWVRQRRTPSVLGVAAIRRESAAITAASAPVSLDFQGANEFRPRLCRSSPHFRGRDESAPAAPPRAAPQAQCCRCPPLRGVRDPRIQQGRRLFSREPYADGPKIRGRAGAVGAATVERHSTIRPRRTRNQLLTVVPVCAPQRAPGRSVRRNRAIV